MTQFPGLVINLALPSLPGLVAKSTKQSPDILDRHRFTEVKEPFFSVLLVISVERKWLVGYGWRGRVFTFSLGYPYVGDNQYIISSNF